MKTLYRKKLRLISLLFGAVLLFAIQLNGQENNLSKRLESHVTILASDSLEGRGIGNESIQQVQEYIVTQFEEAGVSPFRGKYKYPFNLRIGLARVEATNLIGVIEGSDPKLKDEYIVLGAHYDHLGWKTVKGKKVVFNGADDNASGTAGIIEVAKALKGKQLKRSVLVIAFDAEESGLWGSQKLLSDSVLAIDDIKFMFSLDMIGMYSQNKGVALKGMKSLLDGEKFVKASLIEKYIYVTKITERTPMHTDTDPFGRRGVPAVHVFTGLKSPYHKPEDVSGLLDYEGMAEIVEFTSVLTQKLANANSLEPSKGMLAYKKLNEEGPKRFQFGVRINNGFSAHNYQDEFYSAKSIYAVQAGLFTTIKLSNGFFFRPEVLYVFEGSKHNAGNLRVQSVVVPCNLVLGTYEPEEIRSHLFVGPFFQYNFAGEIGGTEMVFETDYKQQNWGINFGFDIVAYNYQLGFFYKQGISDLGLAGANGTVVERGFYLLFGYTF